MNAKKTIAINRKRIDRINKALVKLIDERDRAVKKVTVAKMELDLPMVDPKREREVITNSRKLARELGADPAVVEKVMKIIINHSRGLL